MSCTGQRLRLNVFDLGDLTAMMRCCKTWVEVESNVAATLERTGERIQILLTLLVNLENSNDANPRKLLSPAE